MHGFCTTLLLVYEIGYIGNEDFKLYFSIQCVTFMYVRLIQIACIYIVTKRVENSYSQGGRVQAKGYSIPAYTHNPTGGFSQKINY